MFRWFLVVLLTLVLVSGISPWLRKLGFGRLPGDLNFRFLGRQWSIPLASSLVLSLLASLVARWI
jgi:hypothetical protein